MSSRNCAPSLLNEKVCRARTLGRGSIAAADDDALPVDPADSGVAPPSFPSSPPPHAASTGIKLVNARKFLRLVAIPALVISAAMWLPPVLLFKAVTRSAGIQPIRFVIFY
ncbi:hypothetical protein [Burkholderia gladioli]|uniref:hypothetical protein n=1 Tax=Burkholderia gladioli TaxID=28095 RepID=UPI001FC7F654|nr:hypothetical protein [Burkholderia gladioli]